MTEPILDFRYEPLGGNQIPDGMVIVFATVRAENSVGHLAIEQDGRYRVTFCEALGDRSQAQ
jgi:hypothetical protein